MPTPGELGFESPVWQRIFPSFGKAPLRVRPSFPTPVQIGTGFGLAHNVQYCGSTKWTAVTAWAATTAYSVGNLRRQNATPTVGFERVFRCISAGTSGGSEPLWSTPATAPAYGSSWVDGTVLWQEVTGQSAYGWSAPHARLANALTVPWCAPGDWVYLSNNHAETQATAITVGIANGGQNTSTVALPNVVLCVNDAGSVPPVAADLTTGATITTTGNSAIAITNFLYLYGVAFSCATGAGNGSITLGGVLGELLVLESCALKITATGNAAAIIIFNSGGGTSGESVSLINTTVQFGNVAQNIRPNASLKWIKTLSAVAGTPPTALFVPNVTAYNATVTLIGVDLSALTGSLVSLQTSAPTSYLFQDCELASGVSITTGSLTGPGTTVTVVNSDSANTNYRYYKQTYQGTIQQSTAVTRTGGATDGTTQASRQMVTTANSQFFSPLESDPIMYWNESLSAITLTVPIVVETAGGQAPATGLTNRDVWIEVEYMGTANFPMGVIATSRATNFRSLPTTAPIDGSSVWANALSAPVQQSLTVTFTPLGKGPIMVKVMLARPNTTLYYDRNVVASTGRTWMMSGGDMNEGDDPTQAQVQSGISYNRGDSTGTLVASTLNVGIMSGERM